MSLCVAHRLATQLASLSFHISSAPKSFFCLSRLTTSSSSCCCCSNYYLLLYNIRIKKEEESSWSPFPIISKQFWVNCPRHNKLRYERTLRRYVPTWKIWKPKSWPRAIRILMLITMDTKRYVDDNYNNNCDCCRCCGAFSCATSMRSLSRLQGFLVGESGPKGFGYMLFRTVIFFWLLCSDFMFDPFYWKYRGPCCYITYE